ncbi:hypothetical protein MOQ00_15235 [Stenotrophomonas maltophilia]|nr:hypothetical protein [Stenotrophomonas maltophilia]
MIVALLEFTEAPNGEVLEQLLVIPVAETAAKQLPAQSASVNRVRLLRRLKAVYAVCRPESMHIWSARPWQS